MLDVCDRAMKRLCMSVVAWTMRGRGQRRLLVAAVLLFLFTMARPALGEATASAIGGLIVLAAVTGVIALIIPRRRRLK